MRVDKMREDAKRKRSKQTSKWAEKKMVAMRDRILRKIRTRDKRRNT